VTQATQTDLAAALPRGDGRFLRAARDLALLADGLIACTDSPLLAVAVPSDRWGHGVPVTLWDQRLAPCENRRRQLRDTPWLQPALDALCVAADALFERLEAWGWPDAHAPGLCVISDGTGVAISTHRPRPGDDAGWLLARAADAGAMSTVLPLAEDGIWGLVTEASNLDQTHIIY